MGLDIYLEWPGMTEEEKKARYTGFETRGSAGYLRSSYNDGGFNSWAQRNLSVDGFYHIFGYAHGGDGEVVVGKDEEGEDDHGFFPDWEAATKRTHEMLEKASKLPLLRQVRIPGFILTSDHAIDQEEVLPLYTQERARWEQEVSAGKKPFGAYSARSGEWFMEEPLTVRAAIPVGGILGGNDLVLVCEDPDAHKHYIDSLHHVLQFIELGKAKNGWLSWSA